MKTKRRNFLKTTSLTGLGIGGGSLLHGGVPQASPQEGNDIARMSKQLEKAHVQRFNMSGYAAPPLKRVRIAIIGLGQRGPAHMAIMSQIEGVEIRALCDIRADKANAAKEKLSRDIP